MPLKQIACASVVVILLCCASLVAQSDDPRAPDPYINKYVSMMLLSTIPNAPYVLEREVTTTNKPMAAPGFIAPQSTSADTRPAASTLFVERYKQYRDSRGWLREDVSEAQPTGETPSGKWRATKIYDADARKSYVSFFVNWPTGSAPPSWTMIAQPARSAGPTDVRLIQAGIAGSPANGTAGRGDITYQMLTVSLGSDTMLGLHVEGIRQTGLRAGTGEKFEIEGWFSPELQLPILVKSDDTRHGHVERRVTKLDRIEPDASLFVPPTDYQIVEPKRAAPNPPPPPRT
jgi:hypothetical protein